MMDLILASTSRYRQALLQRLALPFRAENPGVDEEAYKLLGLEPRPLAERLAFEKCQAVAVRHPEAIVIGSDQLVALQGKILGKPGSEKGALEQLRSLSGKTHELVTAVTVLFGEHHYDHTDVTKLRMRTLGDEALHRYIAADKPFDCAGSYKIERLGISLFESIETDDATAVEGLPLIALCRILNRLGIAVP